MATLVRHPNVAALYDFSRLPDGSYYMVWEFIDGVTLEEWMRRHGPLPLPRALDVSRQVLAGLLHAEPAQVQLLEQAGRRQDGIGAQQAGGIAARAPGRALE